MIMVDDTYNDLKLDPKPDLYQDMNISDIFHYTAVDHYSKHIYHLHIEYMEDMMYKYHWF